MKIITFILSILLLCITTTNVYAVAHVKATPTAVPPPKKLTIKTN